MAKVYATGRRKTAVAKVWLENGNGQLTINGQTLDAWLGGHESIKKRVMQPLNVAKQETSVNIIVKTLGGGYSAQADAARHGISRALVAFDAFIITTKSPQSTFGVKQGLFFPLKIVATSVIILPNTLSVASTTIQSLSISLACAI